MENKNDKLSNFIRNRLQSEKDTNDNWDKPDVSIWKKAKSQFTPPKKDRRKVLPFWFYSILLGMLFLVSILSNWHLLKLKNNVKEELEEQIEIVTHLKEEVTEGLIKQQIQEQQEAFTIKEIQLSNGKLVLENEKIKTEWNKLRQQYQGLLILNKEIEESLRSENVKIDEKQSFVINGKRIEKNLNVNRIELLRLSANSFLLTNNLEPIKLDLPTIEIAETSKPKKVIEIGLNYGLSILKVPSSIMFNKNKETSKVTNEVLASTYHLHLAYSLKKNWWLKTGVRHSNHFYTNNFQFKSEYDKSKEFVTPDGTIANKLPIQTSNGYFRTNQNIEIKIPDNVVLDSGDWVFGEFEEKQRIRTLQIPIGLEYRQRNKRFGWQIEASALFNRMTFSNIELKGKIQSTQSEFPTKIVNKVHDSSTSKLLFGVQGGVGLHYQINRRFTLRSDVLFQYNPYFLNQNIQLGLGYQL